MKDAVLYKWERVYPHIGALLITTVLVKLSFNPLNSCGIDSLIEGIVTLDSIIIGFMGAIIPVILSMKNESKLVQYVFEKDEQGLFKKYISETVGYGFFDVSVSLAIYLRDIMTQKYVKEIIKVLFLYGFFLFILSTYRSMACMLKLLFARDDKVQDEVTNKMSQEESDKLWKQKGK